jgi:hypothetical protein
MLKSLLGIKQNVKATSIFKEVMGIPFEEYAILQQNHSIEIANKATWRPHLLS